MHDESKVEHGEMDSLTEMLDEWNWFCIFLTKKDEAIANIWHIIGIVEKPNQEQIDVYFGEVLNDPEFGLVDKRDELEMHLLDKTEFADLIIQMEGHRLQ